MSQTFYVTTAIAYVNSKPHLGHAMEFIEEDAIVRFHRILGHDSYALTGTDEHGTKIVQTAEKAGVETLAFADENAEKFKALKELLHLSYDQFIRTSDQKVHWPSVIKIWNKLVEKGDIYKGSYEGFYCVGCEAFVPESDLVEGKCDVHGKAPEKITEENYFFRLSKYAAAIIKEIESGEFKIVPEFRAKEIINILKTSVAESRDVSFSRPKEVLSWGVPVPGDDSQVMYVWCDALTNYISGLDYANEGELFTKYWANGDEVVQIIGKDILRFHAGIWPAMLMAAEVRRPSTLLVHGFVNMKGEKMSKSKGNVLDPSDLVAEWGIDPIRWYLLREIPMGRDGDFSAERLEEVFASELANGFGNLVQRVCAMIRKYETALVQADASVQGDIKKHWDSYSEHMEQFALHSACQDINELVSRADRYVEENKPWELAKTDTEKLTQVLSDLAGMIRAISVMLYPITPETSGKIRARLGLSEIDTATFDLESELTAGTEGVTIQDGDPLFPRRN